MKPNSAKNEWTSQKEYDRANWSSPTKRFGLEFLESDDEEPKDGVEEKKVPGSRDYPEHSNQEPHRMPVQQQCAPSYPLPVSLWNLMTLPPPPPVYGLWLSKEKPCLNNDERPADVRIADRKAWERRQRRKKKKKEQQKMQ